jgi:hypothetical protein
MGGRKMRDLPQIIDYDRDQLAYALANALKERDEARELLASEKITRNHIIKRTVEVERERDEARTTIEDAKRALNAIGYEGLLLAALRVKEERDEARGAFSELWQYADALLPEIDEETLKRWNKCIKLY